MYSGWCEVCDDRIELDELITRFDQGYAHQGCSSGTWDLTPLPRKPLPPDWRPDGLELAREQVARYAALPTRKSWPAQRPPTTSNR